MDLSQWTQPCYPHFPADLITGACVSQAMGTRTPLPTDRREDTIIVWQQEAKQKLGEGMVRVVVPRSGLHLSTCLRRGALGLGPQTQRLCPPSSGAHVTSLPFVLRLFTSL